MAQIRVDFKKVLEQKKKLVWLEVKKYLDSLSSFPKFCQPAAKYRPLVSFHQKITSDYSQRKGKYLRPTLVLLTAEAMGFPTKKAIRTAAAMQVSEDWMLIHDDVEDDSLQRRGQPALHRIYGSQLAFNAGDALHALMWRILTGNQKVIGPVKSRAIIEEFHRILARTTLGQMVELKWIQ